MKTRNLMVRWTFMAWFILAIGLIAVGLLTIVPQLASGLIGFVVGAYVIGFCVLTVPVYWQIQIDKREKQQAEQVVEQEITQETK